MGAIVSSEGSCKMPRHKTAFWIMQGPGWWGLWQQCRKISLTETPSG
jgi:hypothetical protein